MTLCSVMSHAVIFSYRMLNISTRKRVTKSYQIGYTMNLSDLCNAMKKILDKISCHRYFKEKKVKILKAVIIPFPVRQMICFL